MNEEITYYSGPYMDLVYYNQTTKSYPIHTHTNHYTLGFMVNGAIAIQNNGIDAICNKGEYFFVLPNTVHAFTSMDQNYYTMLSICIESNYLLTTDFMEIQAALCSMLDQAGVEQSDAGWNQEEMEDALQVFYAGLTGITQFESGFAKKLKEQIMHQTDGILSIDEMSKSICISPYHMIREFKKEMGLTPHQFQLQARIRKAQKLLEAKESVINVAYTTGFCDQSHFDRCFHKIVGMSPSEYRDAVRKTC